MIMYFQLKLAETLATEILHRVCKPGSLDVTKEAIFDRYWALDNMSKVFKVGLLLPRLTLSYAVQSHYLSSILEAEEVLMEKFPDQARKQRHEFRYGLCAAETWWCGGVYLGDIEPIFPQRKPPVGNSSPLSDALSAAAYMGHMELVQKLLHEGADLNFTTGYLKPPLQQAASRGHNDILLLLLSKGADIKLGYSLTKGSSDCGALYLATFHGHERTVELLLDHKYDIQPGLSITADIPMVAIQGGHLNLLKMHLETEISTYLKKWPEFGYRMLLRAVQYGHEHIVRWLLQNGVDITKNNPHAWDKPFAPLEIAAFYGLPGMARLLFEYDCNRSVPALAMAARNGHIEVANLLLDTAGEDIDVQYMLHGKRPFRKLHSRDTPLHLAVCHGQVEMVRFLLDRGIEKHFRVLEAADRGVEEILRLLLEAEARVCIDKDYTKLLNRLRKRSHVPKRILDIILELSPITRKRDVQKQKERSQSQKPDPLNSNSTIPSSQSSTPQQLPHQPLAEVVAAEGS